MTNLTDRQRDIDEAVKATLPTRFDQDGFRGCEGGVALCSTCATNADRIRQAFSRIQSERRLERLRCKAASGMRGSVAARAEMRRVRNAQLREALRS